MARATARSSPLENIPDGTSPAALVVHDFNGDGRLDLASLDNDSGDVSVFLAKRHGFAHPTTTPTGPGSPYGMVGANFDSDHHMDLAVTDCAGIVSSVYLLHGAGDGSFGPAAPFLGGFRSCSYEPAAADLNGDGKTDLVTQSDDGDVFVLYGRKHGKLGAAKPYPAVTEAYSTAVAKLNGDKLPDLAVPDYHTPHVAILYGKKK